jgi:hypothetical protein
MPRLPVDRVVYVSKFEMNASLPLASMSNPYGADDVGAAGHARGLATNEEQQLIDEGYGERERAMELMGITPTTFSNNIQFEVPRFLQDGFGPALLHPASSSVPPPSYPSDFAGCVELR